jgi:hypothetical protein
VAANASSISWRIVLSFFVPIITTPPASPSMNWTRFSRTRGCAAEIAREDRFAIRSEYSDGVRAASTPQRRRPAESLEPLPYVSRHRTDQGKWSSSAGFAAGGA